MSAYSRRIFPEDAPVCVAEDLVGKLAEPARKDAEQVESAQEELEREEAAQKEPWQQPDEAAFCLIEEAVNLENEMIDEWIVFRWKRAVSYTHLRADRRGQNQKRYSRGDLRLCCLLYTSNTEHCIGLQATERCMVCFGESSFFQKKKLDICGLIHTRTITLCSI